MPSGDGSLGQSEGMALTPQLRTKAPLLNLSTMSNSETLAHGDGRQGDHCQNGNII
jgi:hypothetical protein